MQVLVIEIECITTKNTSIVDQHHELIMLCNEDKNMIFMATNKTSVKSRSEPHHKSLIHEITIKMLAMSAICLWDA